MENRREKIKQGWRQLSEEYEPRIQAARVELEEIEREYEDVRRRRAAAQDKHKKLIDEYNARWAVVGQTGGK